jgi:hypothetical protein
MSYEAGRVLSKDIISRTSFNRFDAATLRRLCEEQNINVKSTRVGGGDPIKADYILALFAQVCSAPVEMTAFSRSHVFRGTGCRISQPRV